MDSMSYSLLALGPSETAGLVRERMIGSVRGKSVAFGRVMPQKCGQAPSVEYYTAEVRQSRRRGVDGIESKQVRVLCRRSAV